MLSGLLQSCRRRTAQLHRHPVGRGGPVRPRPAGAGRYVTAGGAEPRQLGKGRTLPVQRLNPGLVIMQVFEKLAWRALPASFAFVGFSCLLQRARRLRLTRAPTGGGDICPPEVFVDSGKTARPEIWHVHSYFLHIICK